MKIDGQISIFVGEESTTIDIYDKDASTRFASIKLTPEQLSMALSRLSHTPCSIEVHGLDRVGKLHENKQFEFEIPENLRGSKYADELREIAQPQLTDGWIVSDLFQSQGSFFQKNGKQYARCTIRRWVDKQEGEVLR